MGNDDDEELTDDQLLEMPTQAMPGDLSRLWAKRANAIYNRELNELVAELTGASSSHRMIFPDQDPVAKRQREEEAARRAAQEMQDYFERSNRLLARIDEQERVIAKRRQEIEDNALKLHDGRRVYVDGNQYRDEQGQVLEGRDRDEAAALHNQKPHASTWQDRRKTIEEADDLARLKQKVLNDRQEAERGGDVTAATDRLSGYEKEFQNDLETTRTEIAAMAPADLAASYSTDYMAACGDEYTISTVPAFTKAANQTDQKTDKNADTETAQTKMAPQPSGQGALKL